MIAALLCGVEETTGEFPGRNLFPLIGRPLMLYPLLAARHATCVDAVFLSTDSKAMSDIAAANGAMVILRPPELCRKGIPFEKIVEHAIAAISSRGNELEAVVVLLCNAPTVNPEIIETAIGMLRADRTADAVATVGRHNEFNPLRAKKISPQGVLEAAIGDAAAVGAEDRDRFGSVYFIDGALMALRTTSFRLEAAHTPRPAYAWLGSRVLPLVRECGADIDYEWQIPMAEFWLRRQGFSEALTPYEKVAARPAVAAAAPPATARLPFRTLITTVPFGAIEATPVRLLEEAKIPFTINPLGRKLKEDELAELAQGYEILIAGTEPITAKVMDAAPSLKLIARVGIGLDNVDLQAARERGIQVSYTPEAPSTAVAELTVAQMLALLRMTNRADRGLRQGVWKRWTGRRLALMTVGIVGMGRIGKLVARHLAGFGTRILANDLVPDRAFASARGIEWVDKEILYRTADVITLHVPLTSQTREMISAREMAMMKPGVLLVNTARGGIVHEADLAEALRTERLGGAAIDVFEREPYSGELAALENCLMTCHMGSCSDDCRLRMEVEATEDAVRFCQGEPLLQPVPEQEYQING